MMDHSKKPLLSTEDLGEATKQCERHGEYTSRGRAIQLTKSRRETWSRCPGCEADDAKAAADLVKVNVARIEAEKMEKMLGRTCLPPKFIGRTFDNFKAETPEQQKALAICQAFAENFDRNLERGGSLVLSGAPGTGKSHLAAAILQSILPAHVGAYFTVMDLIRLVRDTWRQNSESSESAMLAKIAAIPLLVIDEVGVQYGTDGERTILFDVMDRRYRDMRPAIMLTNLASADFKESVGERVFDRLTETATWVPFAWGSYRRQARAESA